MDSCFPGVWIDAIRSTERPVKPSFRRGCPGALALETVFARRLSRFPAVHTSWQYLRALLDEK